MRAIILAALLLAGCNQAGPTGSPATLYRNSPIDPGLRVQFATFDSPSGGGFNLNNCGMVARLLNANVDASAEAQGKLRDPTVGFWCEAGLFSEEGSVPATFESEYPSDVRSGVRW